MSNGIVLGLDTSHYQGKFDYAAAYAKGARFAGIQLTVGTGDDAFGQANVQRALAAGMYVLPYAFTNNTAHGADQADHFRDALGPLISNPRVYPVQDMEPKEGATAKHCEDFFDRWFGQAYGRIGEYGGPGAFAHIFGRKFNLAAMFPGIRLRWNADYRGPLVTSADDGRFDLYYSNGIYGYGGWSSAQIVQDGSRFGTDGDVFAGSEADLAALFAGPQPPKPTVTYRFGASPAHNQQWQAITHAPLFAAPGVGSKRQTAYAPGHKFHVAQSIKRDNGRLWLGNNDGTRWVLADGRVKRI